MMDGKVPNTPNSFIYLELYVKITNKKAHIENDPWKYSIIIF